MKPTSRPNRVCILGCAGAAADYGDHASTWELVRLLNRCWADEGPFALHTVTRPERATVGRAGWQRVVHAAVESNGTDAGVKHEMLRIARDAFGAAVDSLSHAELVIVQGTDDPSASGDEAGLLGLVMPWVAQHVFSRRVAWLNQSAGASPAGGASREAHVGRLAEALWCRDPLSFWEFCKAGCRQSSMVPDTAFLVEPLEHGTLAEDLQGRPYFCVDAGSLSADLGRCLEAVRLLAAATGLLPVFVGTTSTAAERLPAAAAAVGIESSAVPADTIYPAVADIVGRAACLVGRPGRLAMMAAIGGTPTVSVAGRASGAGLRELLGVDWPEEPWSRGPELAAAAARLVGRPASERDRLRDHVAGIRAAVVNAYSAWRPAAASPPPLPSAAEYGSRGEGTPYTPVRSQLLPLTVYLRRGITPAATFHCLRQLVECRLADVLEELDSRWLVSVCDSYADHGDPLESRNALLIATFLNWERIAATHALWADPLRCTMRVDAPPPATNGPIWDGLTTIHLRRGDTVNNMLIRYARALAVTPALLAIWRTLLARIRNADSVLAALDRPHGHLFDAHLAWMSDERLTDIPRWRRPPPPTP